MRRPRIQSLHTNNKHQSHDTRRMYRAWLLSILVVLFFASGCGSPLPNVTPTLAPTNTPPDETEVAIEASRTPIIRLSPTVTQTATATETETNTPTSTATDEATDEAPPTTTNTPTATLTPLPTETPLPTDTPSITPSPTLTPLPLPIESDTPTPTNTPSITPSPTASATPTATNTLRPSETPSATWTASATFTPSVTFTPSPTFTPTFDGTLIAQGLQTQAAQATQNAQQTQVAQIPTFTAVPLASPTITLAPLEVTRITATPGGESLGIILASPIPSTPEPQPDVQTDVTQIATPIPTPTIAFPTPLPPNSITTGFVTPLPPPIFNTQFDLDIAPAFTFNGAQAFNFNGRELQGGIRLFAPNPAFPNSFARTLPSGLLVFSPPNGAEQPATFAPFFEGYDAFDANSNKNYVSDIAWSPNGLQMAFIITPPENTDNISAGVWFWQPEQTLSSDPSYALLHDCPAGNWLSCGLVGGRPANYWRSLKISWSPDSTRVLVTLDLPEEGRQAIAVLNAVRDAQYANSAPPIARYDSATWLPDGRLLVSGRRPSDGRVIIGTVNADFSDERVLLDATGLDLWVQDAAQRPDGGIVALGRPCCPGGALRLYRADGVPLSDFIGNNTPERIKWANDNTSVVVSVGGMQYVVNAYNGAITRVDGTNDIAISDIGSQPIAQAPVGGVTYPQGVLEGSRYTPAQQVRYVGDAERNMRDIPNLNSSRVIGSVLPSEFVAIVAGPYESDGFVWWQVLNGRGVQGWVAAESGGVSLLSP
jgi:hypothetical protein